LTPLGKPPVAVLVHDPALLGDRELLDAAVAAARLALDNARLYAEVHAQLAEVRASRQRSAAAADRERQRLERDLHDGAQQRLLAIGFMLGVLRTRLGNPADQEMVHELEQELRTAMAELRDFAQGIRPAILTDQGLAPALAGLARRSRLRVSLDVRLTERLDPVVESTAYYMVSEALQNVAKHTEDARACVSAVHEGDRLVIEVTDDGPGGASMRSGTGLRGLADRVNAIGGDFGVKSSPGDGTTIRAELPCG
jgi:signal transduction histidine kinase